MLLACIQMRSTGSTHHQAILPALVPTLSPAAGENVALVPTSCPFSDPALATSMLWFSFSFTDWDVYTFSESGQVA